MRWEYVNHRIITVLMYVFCGQPGQLKITVPAADMSGEYRSYLFSLVISILVKSCGPGN